ncbi:MAG: serine hydrolase [Gammaproteobacteria bacterium]|nr:serine hydrolase [Gammaproteobacteria bacterium]
MPLTGVIADADIPSLPESPDPALQSRLERSLGQMGLSQATQEGRLSVALVDITERTNPRLAAVNADLMMYSASLPKIAILFGAFQRIEEGVLKRTNEFMQDMTDMIRHSSNTAATRVLNMVGPGYLNQLLQSSPYRLYDVQHQGGLWVGKPYGKSPAYQRDPLHSISHGATVWQVARYYYLLENGKLVSPAASSEMKKILANPAIHHKFVGGLLATHPDASIYRKSGTWRTYHSDSAIVERNGRRYIAVALANDVHGDEWMRKLIVAMDDIIFTQSYAALGAD